MRKSLIILFMVITTELFAGDGNRLTWQVDLLNRHYWRGNVFGNGPAIEPQFAFGHKNFTFNVWASYTFDQSYSEIDLYPVLALGNFEFTLFDYYNPIPGEENRFFDFSSDGNRHSGEIVVDFASPGFPLELMWATFLYGDGHLLTNEHMYSTYFQAAYPFKFAGTDVELSAAMTPWEGYYNDGIGWVHAGLMVSDQIRIDNRTSVPLKFALNFNPAASRAWVIFSIGLGRTNE